MKIVNYIKKNWEKLPKSRFNGDEVVIFHCNDDSNGGWGNHSYNGYGVDRTGNVVWCYSSGCSCSGSCGVDHVKDFKTLIIKDNESFESIIPKNVNFESLEVSFSDY